MNIHESINELEKVKESLKTFQRHLLRDLRDNEDPINVVEDVNQIEASRDFIRDAITTLKKYLNP